MVSLISIFILGLVHGLTPDEHTWPIVFAYILSNSRNKRKAVLKMVLLFVCAAAVPWITISGVSSYLGSVIWKEGYEIYVHFILGFAMIITGLYILQFFKIPHLHFRGDCDKEQKEVKSLNVKQLPFYGLILGFAPCAPVLIMYGFAARLHNIYYGILSGFLFGLGTMVSLVIVSTVVGKGLQMIKDGLKKDLSKIFSRISGIILVIFGLWVLVSAF